MNEEPDTTPEMKQLEALFKEELEKIQAFKRQQTVAIILGKLVYRCGTLVGLALLTFLAAFMVTAGIILAVRLFGG